MFVVKEKDIGKIRRELHLPLKNVEWWKCNA
jgi:hypothetical protein